MQYPLSYPIKCNDIQVQGDFNFNHRPNNVLHCKKKKKTLYAFVPLERLYMQGGSDNSYTIQ